MKRLLSAICALLMCASLAGAQVAPGVVSNGGGGGIATNSNAQLNSLGVGEAASGTAGDASLTGRIYTGSTAAAQYSGVAVGDIGIARGTSNAIGQIYLGTGNHQSIITGTVDGASNADMQISPAGQPSLTVGNVYSQLRHGLTFSNLPACSSSFEGALASITDSTVATWGSTITGGSTNHVLAYCDGTNWTVAGK